jgi:hypothetical protein
MPITRKEFDDSLSNRATIKAIAYFIPDVFQ